MWHSWSEFSQAIFKTFDMESQMELNSEQRSNPIHSDFVNDENFDCGEGMRCLNNSVINHSIIFDKRISLAEKWTYANELHVIWHRFPYDSKSKSSSHRTRMYQYHHLILIWKHDLVNALEDLRKTWRMPIKVRKTKGKEDKTFLSNSLEIKWNFSWACCIYSEVFTQSRCFVWFTSVIWIDAYK